MAISFTSFSGTLNPTPWAQYDSDAQFQADADKVVYYVQNNLGAPVVDSEMDLRGIWTAFEQATLEYSQTINSHHAKNVLLDLLGQPTGSLSGSENSLPIFNSQEFARRVTVQYSHEFGTNSPYPLHTASIDLTSGVQTYDLYSAISGSIPDGSSVKIRKIHHYEPTHAFRFFDTTSVLNFMGNSVGFESYSPETIFYLLPIWEDVLRGTQLALNQRVRRSNYSFDINGFDLRLYPVPNKTGQKLYFEYTVNRDPLSSSIGASGSTSGMYQTYGVTSNLSNVAFGHLGYSDINSIGKTWIWRMTLAFCREILGEIREKYGNLPVPTGGDVTLNGTQLIQRGREDQLNLRQELRELLDEMSYKNLMAERQELQEIAVKEHKMVPLLIYRSR